MKAILYTAAFLVFTALTPCVAQEVEAIEVQPSSDLPETSITFKQTSYDFGEVEEGTVVKHVFKFTNTGSEPLVIKSAQGSCGCTVPFYPKVAILPGESSEIQVSFNSANRLGQQQKTVTLYANTSPEISILKINGNVLPSEKPEGETEAERAKREEEWEAMAALNPNCFAIYPNPTNSELQLELKDYIGFSANVHITNANGQVLETTRINKINSENTVFDIRSYTPGIYQITIEVDGKKPMTQCFVVTGE